MQSRSSGPVQKVWLRLPGAQGNVRAEWRATVGFRVFSLLCLGVALAIGTLLATNPATFGTRMDGIGFLVLYPIFFWCTSIRPRLVLTDTHVVVVNLLVSYVIPLSAVGDAEARSSGLRVAVRNNWPPAVLAYAVPQPGRGIRIVFRLADRAGQVAAVINEAARAASPT